MESYKSALNILFNIQHELETEIISVRNSLNRVVAEDVCLDIDYPDTLRSAVDGYAVKFSETGNYDIIGTVAAGELHEYELEEAEALFVMTGGIVPESADAVVRVENSECYGSHLYVKNEFIPGDNINKPGEEAEKGYKIIEKGELIKDTVYPALFYAGKQYIEVYKKVKIGVLITGDEIHEIEDGYQKGRVFNTNQYIIESFFQGLPVEIFYVESVKDDETLTFNRLNEMMNDFDIVITSGGISMGKFDYVKKIFNERGFNILINKTKIKPGSPLIVAEKNNTLFFGMPGYPAAFTTNLILYLRPYLKKICGFKDYENKYIKAKLKTKMKSRLNTDYFNRGRYEIENGEFFVSDLNSQKTSHYLNFAKANCLVHLDKEVSELDENDEVDIIAF